MRRENRPSTNCLRMRSSAWQLLKRLTWYLHEAVCLHHLHAVISVCLNDLHAVIWQLHTLSLHCHTLSLHYHALVDQRRPVSCGSLPHPPSARMVHVSTQICSGISLSAAASRSTLTTARSSIWDHPIPAAHHLTTAGPRTRSGASGCPSWRRRSLICIFYGALLGEHIIQFQIAEWTSLFDLQPVVNAVLVKKVQAWQASASVSYLDFISTNDARLLALLRCLECWHLGQHGPYRRICLAFLRNCWCSWQQDSRRHGHVMIWKR
mmetsp:Transcript_45908/g.82673  ORF Transcript_45908/g.82673 Transcript_45908/m.82673 type:complete len:265 (+) Transcript_45908:155-949(+)